MVETVCNNNRLNLGLIFHINLEFGISLKAATQGTTTSNNCSFSLKVSFKVCEFMSNHNE